LILYSGKQGSKMWTRCNWLKAGAGYRFLWKRWWTFGFYCRWKCLDRLRNDALPKGYCVYCVRWLKAIQWLSSIADVICLWARSKYDHEYWEIREIVED
jgi:hypothetical protein